MNNQSYWRCTCGGLNRFERNECLLCRRTAGAALIAATAAAATAAATVVTAAALPDQNPKTIFGTRKPTLSAIPPSALLHLGAAMATGRTKYGQFNWRDQSVTASTYYDAALRHLLSYWDGEDLDPESKLHPLAHVMACCAIILDAEACKTIVTDRHTPGKTPELIAAWTKPIAKAAS